MTFRFSFFFSLQGADSFFDDCIHHLMCPFCTLTQVCICSQMIASCIHLFIPFLVQLACECDVGIENTGDKQCT